MYCVVSNFQINTHTQTHTQQMEMRKYENTFLSENNGGNCLLFICIHRSLNRLKEICDGHDDGLCVCGCGCRDPYLFLFASNKIIIFSIALFMASIDDAERNFSFIKQTDAEKWK